MNDDDGAFPVYTVDDGPDPKVRVSRGLGLWFDDGEARVQLHPTMMAIHGLKLDGDQLESAASVMDEIQN